MRPRFKQVKRLFHLRNFARDIWAFLIVVVLSSSNHRILSLKYIFPNPSRGPGVYIQSSDRAWYQFVLHFNGRGGMDAQPPVRILSSDSGGVRGISSHYILQILMQRIGLQLIKEFNPPDMSQFLLFGLRNSLTSFAGFSTDPRFPDPSDPFLIRGNLCAYAHFTAS